MSCLILLVARLGSIFSAGSILAIVELVCGSTLSTGLRCRVACFLVLGNRASLSSLLDVGFLRTVAWAILALSHGRLHANIWPLLGAALNRLFTRIHAVEPWLGFFPSHWCSRARSGLFSYLRQWLRCVLDYILLLCKIKCASLRGVLMIRLLYGFVLDQFLSLHVCVILPRKLRVRPSSLSLRSSVTFIISYVITRWNFWTNVWKSI